MIRVYGTAWCGDCKRAKKFFGEQRVHYDWVDVEQDAEGLRSSSEANNGKRIIPTIFFGDGSVADRAVQRRAGRPSWASDRAGHGFLRPDRRRRRAGRADRRALRAREGIETLVIERRRPGRAGGRHRAARQLPRLPGGHRRRRVRRPAAPRRPSASASRCSRGPGHRRRPRKASYREVSHRRRRASTTPGRCCSRPARPTAAWACPARRTSSAPASTSAPPATGLLPRPGGAGHRRRQQRGRGGGLPDPLRQQGHDPGARRAVDGERRRHREGQGKP